VCDGRRVNLILRTLWIACTSQSALCSSILCLVWAQSAHTQQNRDSISIFFGTNICRLLFNQTALQNIRFISEISGYHGSKYEVYNLLGHSTIFIELDQCFKDMHYFHHQGDDPLIKYTGWPITMWPAMTKFCSTMWMILLGS
jgi:hypothetical protein